MRKLIVSTVSTIAFVILAYEVYNWYVYNYAYNSEIRRMHNEVIQETEKAQKEIMQEAAKMQKEMQKAMQNLK